MKRISYISTAMIMMCCGVSQAEPILLASIVDKGGLGGSNFGGADRIEFTLSLQPDNTNHLPPGIGQGIFWREDSIGFIDLTEMNDPIFADFAEFITNGVDDLFTKFASVPNGGGGGGGAVESTILSQSPLVPELGPDLVGHTLDFGNRSRGEIGRSDPGTAFLAWRDGDFRRFFASPSGKTLVFKGFNPVNGYRLRTSECYRVKL